MPIGLKVLFDANGCIKRYETVDEIFREFYDERFDLYVRRKDYMEGMLSAESLRLDNQARFIMEKCDGIIVIGILDYSSVLLLCLYLCCGAVNALFQFVGRK